ncbi:MAG: threonylcarbamoyl-AMP synthase [Nanoarchaeota archaeon]|nr:threonylcarbamoyl-AMP synthase [Nanoarchaeota archaeon]
MMLNFEGAGFEVVPRLLKEIFIYPTDTIYGIGCNAENEKLVNKIRRIKRRDKRPFSVIAPSFEWILKNCEIDERFLKKYFPGPYTLILKKKHNKFLSHVSDTDYIGVRIPAHPFTKILQKTGKPIITTSVNFAGERHANNINGINKEILDNVDLVIDAGMLPGKPSTIINGNEVIKRG